MLGVTILAQHKTNNVILYIHSVHKHRGNSFQRQNYKMRLKQRILNRPFSRKWWNLNDQSSYFQSVLKYNLLGVHSRNDHDCDDDYVNKPEK
jgi:hypothetical protein